MARFTFRCANCPTTFVAEGINGIDLEAAHTLEHLPSDRMGHNNGWGCCPHCQTVISKGSGCNHMLCAVCRQHFDWNDALEHKEKLLFKYPMAKTTI
mmetsp:Transcript_10762/g.24007  ORF Transcript_10762/g.24007 Transcript_10762/m.24007 type:complete len:97 (-) Transcript_10762:3469-3759(-)